MSGRFRLAVALAAALLASTPPAAAKKTPPPLCLDARQLLVVSGATLSLVDECAGTAFVRRATPKGTRLQAVWPDGACHDLRGRVKLVATIAPGCGAVAGSVVAKKARFHHAVRGQASTCGDDFFDAGRGEACDGGHACAADASCTSCTCVPGSPTTTLASGATTTTLPAVATRCCQAVGACIDAAGADAASLCTQLQGSLAPAGQVCDAGNTAHSPNGPQCGAVQSHGGRCCQCPVSSPPYPHSTYCFEGNTTTCGACTRTDGVGCDPVSETCGP